MAMPEIARLVLDEYVALGDASAPEIYRRFRDRDTAAGKERQTLTLVSAYHVTGWLHRNGYLEDIGCVNERTRYRPTQQGGGDEA